MIPNADEYSEAISKAIMAVEVSNLWLPVPLCIVEDRYGGAYSDAYYLAFKKQGGNSQLLVSEQFTQK